MALLSEAFVLGTAPPALPSARLSAKHERAGADVGERSSGYTVVAAGAAVATALVAQRRQQLRRTPAVAMNAKRKKQGGPQNAAAKAKALKALQVMEQMKQKEAEEAAQKKAQKARKNGRTTTVMETQAPPAVTNGAKDANGKNGKVEAKAPVVEEVKEAQKPLAEAAKVEEEEPPKPVAEAKVEEKEAQKPVAEAAKVEEEKEPPKPAAEAKVEEKEAQKPLAEAAKAEEEKEPPKPVAEAKVEEKEPEKPAAEVKEEELKKPEAEAKEQDPEKPAADVKEEATGTPHIFSDLANLADILDTLPQQEETDAIGAIGAIHSDHDLNWSNGASTDSGNRREVKRASTTEIDREAYYSNKKIDEFDEETREWADDPEYWEEEEPEEEPVMIKRRRGEQDQVDFGFLNKGAAEGEVIVGIREVAVRLGGRQVLQDASWTVKTGEKLALVGANGCGKTTQLRVLLNQLTPERGEVVKSPPNARVAILEQSFVDDLNPEHTLREELLAALPEQKAILDELRDVEAALKENPDDQQEQERLINRFTDLTSRAEDFQTHKLEPQMQHVKEMAGFLETDMDRKVGLFSGGWKVRLGVAKIFMQSPDVLLLDEPTNHLDLVAVEWIEKFITGQNIPIVVVTHDREFMNRTCNRVIETVEGMTYSYEGNYTKFMEQKEEKMAQWKKKWDLQEKKRKELEEFIKVNRGVQSLANTRQKRMKELEELKEKGLDPPPAFVKRISFRFPEPQKDRRGGALLETLAELRGVNHGYGTELDDEYELLKDCDFLVTPGDKIGIVGGNGKGKSTLLRLLMGMEKPSYSGKVRTADPEMTGFFAQHQADLLPMDKTGWQVVKEANEILMDDRELQEIMKKFRFRGDRMHVKIASLSGGEKARLAIVRMMLIPSRMLIFDEPTNHLDVPMKETLEFALREYQGAVVVVSHDRWFLSQTCRKIVEIKDGDVKIYDGDFRFYMDSNQDVRTQIESHYTGIDGLIESVPQTLEERKKKERKGLRKNRRAKAEQEKREQLQSMFLNRERRR